jgi:PAS domain S-box-containing protein
VIDFTPPSREPSDERLPSIGTAEQYEQILNSIPDLILVKGPKSRLLWSNRAFLDFYGMTNEQLKGILDAPFNDPDYTQQYVKDDAWVFENGKALDIPCEPVTRHDGRIFYFHTVKSPIFDASGKVVMTVGLSRDITSSRAAEMALLQASKMAALGEMAGGVAHEINNPLAIIQGRAFNLLRCLQAEPGNTATMRTFAESILSTAERIAKIVRGLRSFARDGERDPMRPESLRTVIADTLELCRERIRNHGIELRVGEIPADWMVSCRATQISQILVNLLNNAHDATQGKPGSWISVSAQQTREGAEIRICDSGNGIAEPNRSRIMQPFFTTKPHGLGSGLGLSISRRLAEEHGGRLEYDPSAKNTTFVLILPNR